MIEDYLRELNGLLRVGPLRRRRILAEVEAHLRDDGGGAAALERFGPPAEVAARFNAVALEPPARVAAALVLGGALFAFAAVQGLEDYLPPAPWPTAADAPVSLRATFTAATVAVLVAAGAAIAAFVLPRLLRRLAAAVSCVALAACVALLCANAVVRAGYVPGSPSVAGPIVLSVLAVAPAAAGLLILSRRVARRCF